MSPDAFPLIIVLFVLLAIGVGVYQYRARQQRRQAFAALGAQHGLHYSQQDTFGTLGEPFHLFQRGDGRGIENMLDGDWQGMPIRGFDYWYYDESTDSNGHTSKSYYRFDCVIAPIEAACSPLTIDHENVLTRLADAVALRDIEFESEDFDHVFNVKGPDRKFANDFIDARMMRWLLEHGGGYSFEVVGDQLMCFCKKVAPEQVPLLFVTMKSFREQVPEVVFSLYPKSG